MYPSFEDEEFLLTDKISYRFNEPQRGDVVVFKAPPSEPCAPRGCEYIKRIIGLPGETVRIENNAIFINNKKLEEFFLPADVTIQGGNFLPIGKTITLEEDEYLLLGDNRSYSRDSREFGPIERKNLVGKAWLVYWPPDRIGIVKRGKFNQ